jgi:hypothetical protein
MPKPANERDTRTILTRLLPSIAPACPKVVSPSLVCTCEPLQIYLFLALGVDLFQGLSSANAFRSNADNRDVKTIDSHLKDATGEAVSAWFRVQLVDGSLSWRHETSMWLDKKAEVLKYWRRFDNGHVNKGRYRALRLTVKDAFYPNRIAGEKVDKQGQSQYLVDWVGCLDLSYEPAEILRAHHQDLIDDWLARRERQKTDNGAKAAVRPEPDGAGDVDEDVGEDVGVDNRGEVNEDGEEDAMSQGVEISQVLDSITVRVAERAVP